MSRRGIRPEDAEKATEYLETIKKGIEKEGKEALKLAGKAKRAPYKGMAIGTAAGATIGYGAHKYLKHKNQKK